MQRIFNAGCSAEEYQSQGKSYPFPDLCGELCPHCKSDRLRKHGYYNRYLITSQFSGVLVIRRYICKTCKHTLSLLPSFAHPNRAYGIEPIISVLSRFYMSSKRVCEAISGSVCSRQLLRWFRIRIEQNLNMLVMELTETLSLRSPPVSMVDIRKRVGQFFEHIRSFRADDISLKIYERTRKTYLSPLT